MNDFKEVSVSKVRVENTFDLISKKWMLITAGSKNSFNTMTASWGCMGFLWNKNVSVCFVRPERYTFEFIEQNELYTLSFYPEEYRDVLTYCGTHSGKDVDKVKKTGLNPVFSEKAPYFKEASLVFVCKKMYTDYIEKRNILDGTIITNYYNGDSYHKMYIGEIVKVLKKIND